MPSIFTKIIQGELPCHKIYEDELTMAFLTIEPINPGHTLVIPKEEVDHITDVETPVYQMVMNNAQMIARAIHKVSGKKRVTMAIQGFEVPHFHVHLIPADGPSEFDFKRARPADKSDLTEMADKIKSVL